MESHNAVLITAKLPVSIDEGEEVKIYANADIFLKKYLDVFDKTTLTIETNDDVVVMTDDNLTLYMPQISPEVAAMSTGRLKKELEFDVKVTFPAKDFKRIYKAMNKLDEDSITFAIKGRKLEILAGKKAILNSDAEIAKNGLGEVV